MSKKIKNEQKKFLGETLNQYDKALNEGIAQLDKKNREQNHKISSLVNSFDNEYLEKDVEGNMTTLENSKDGMVIINEIQGSTEVNYCKDGEKELILNGDIDTQGESFVTITEGVDGGLVDVSLEGNTEINLSKTKDPVLVTREFDDINCNVGKLQYTIDDVTTINDEPGKVDIDRIVGDTVVNHAVNGSEELILNAHINESGDNNITLNGVTSDGGKVDVTLEGNTLVNVSNVKDDYITPTIEDKVDQGSVISLPEASEGYINIDSIEGNTLVNYCTDGAKELTLNGDIDVEGNFVTVTEGVDNGLVDVMCEGNTLVNLADIQSTFIDSTLTTHYRDGVLCKTSSLKLNTAYTFIIEKEYLEGHSMNYNYFEIGVGNPEYGTQAHPTMNTNSPSFKYDDNKYQTMVITVTFLDFKGYEYLAVRPCRRQSEPVEGEVGKYKVKVVLLEGDWTNKEIPPYFEGMKSVGQDDENGHKIEILSQSNLANIATSGNTNFRVANVKAGVSYSIKSTRSDNTVRYNLLLHDIDGSGQGTIKSSVSSDFCTFTPFKDGVLFFNAYIGNTLISDIMLVKGVYTEDTMPQFKPYTSNKKEILMNEPLRGLPNGVKDRIVKINNKYFVERNCGKFMLDGDTTKATYSGGVQSNELYHNIIIKIKNDDAMKSYDGKYKYVHCEKIPYLFDAYPSVQSFGINQYVDTSATFVGCIPTSKLGDRSKAQYFKDNPTEIIYNLATPTYEPLEIEPVLNTYNDITHISNNSIIPCNMKIQNSGYNAIIKPSTLYTVALDTNKSGTIGMNLGGAKVTTTNNVATITTPATLTDDSLRLYGKGIKASKVRLLEGDKTNWIPEFFEGMKSSFEDKVQDDGSYKIEVLMSNENLCDNGVNYENWETQNSLQFDKINNGFILDNSKARIAVKRDLNLIDGEKYTITFNVKFLQNSPRNKVQFYNFSPNTTLAYYGNSVTEDGVLKSTFVYNSSLKCIGIYFHDESSIEPLKAEITNIIINKGSESSTYIPHKSNKIQLSSIEPLRGINEIHDRLVFKDGKLMIERNCGEVVLNGNENYWQGCSYLNVDNIKYLRYYTNNDIGVMANSTLLCDKFNNNLNKGTIVFMNSASGLFPNGIQFQIHPSSGCIDDDMNSWKQWLQNNPTTVAYQLKEPTYEEIPYELQKIILESYKNGTLFIDTNIPPTKVSFNCFEEELTYLYPATSYTVQFMSDRNTTADISLGGTQLLAQNIVTGLNRIAITTPSELADSKLLINGAGAKISEVVVTDTDREFDYFEGMKSVGECEELEVKSGNKNLFDYNKFCEFVDERKSNNPNGYYYHGFRIKVKPNTVYRFTREDDSGLGLGCHIVINDIENDYKSYSSFFRWIAHSTANINNSEGNFNTENRNYIYINTAFTSDISDDIINNMKRIMSTFQLEEGSTATDYIPHQSNKQQLIHEPLRALGNVKDKYAIVDGKWYIERRCGSAIFDGSDDENWIVDNQYGDNGDSTHATGLKIKVDDIINVPDGYGLDVTGVKLKCNLLVCIPTYGKKVNGINYGWGKNILIKFDRAIEQNEFRNYLKTNPLEVIYPLEIPQYEPIDYNPLVTYSDITHITTNSTIPTNLTIKNHGYNMVALKENTQYTLYVNKDTTNALTYRLGDYVEINSLSKFTFTTPSTLTDKTLRIDGKGAKVNDLMLIEGTPTNDSIGYFDGLKSSYECEQVTDENDVNYGKYKVDVKVVGKNLFDGTISQNYLHSESGKEAPHDQCGHTSYLKLAKNKAYIVSTNHNQIYCYSVVQYDENKNIISAQSLVTSSNKFTTTSNCSYVRLSFMPNVWDDSVIVKNDLTNLQIEEGDTVTEYEPYFESKQTIYLNSPLLKGDEIVWKDNKIQHYHKMKTVVLDDSDDENWSLASISTQKTNVNVFDCNVADSSIINDAKISTFSDKLPSYSASYLFNTVDIEGIGQPSRRIRICLSKSKASTIEGFKQWLQQNPIKVVYELETPYYEEISDYPLKLNAIANSSLSTESTIQVTNISFNIYEETLPYLYPNTKYYITFNADVDRNNIIINLGGNHVVFDCKVGFNKVEITTPSDTTNLLTFSGTGVNIDHVKVTQQDIDEYFEGMKSVGECEELEITSANSDNTLSNSQTLTHEPLRAVGDVKDKYVMIDNKWYIERNCNEAVLEGSDDEVYTLLDDNFNNVKWFGFNLNNKEEGRAHKSICSKFINSNLWTDMELIQDAGTTSAWNCNTFIAVSKSKLSSIDVKGLKEWLIKNPTAIVYKLATPSYEPIDYNPFETYSDITHISVNSLIPSNMVIKNHGYNCILKPSTTYTIALNKPNGTISAKLGGSAKVDSANSVFTITTPSTLNDNVLRLSGSGNVKDIMILEGDKTINTPSYFEGIESVFEQEYDVEKGKYRVTARVEGNGKESSIIFYINEPLRGTGITKDKVFIQDGKVVVQRNCSSITLDGSENIHKANTDFDSVNNISFSIDIDNIAPSWDNCNNIVCSTLPNVGNRTWKGNMEGITSNDIIILLCISRNKLQTQDVNGFKQWLQANPTKVVYVLAEPVYEEADCDLSKLVLENYENSSLILESNIPVSANIRYSGEVPVVTQAKSLSSQVDNTTLDINENIIPYMCDIDYRIVELQLMNGDTQGEGIELLGIGDIEILSNENVLFNNREDKKYNYSYDMLKRDILSQRYSKEEYQYRLDRYLLANKISDEEYKELEGLLNNGE